MAGKQGTYRLAHTWANYNEAGVMTYETGRSPVNGPITITGSTSYGATQPTDSQINRWRIYSTLTGGSVYYLEKVVTISATGLLTWTTLNMPDSTLKLQASAYWTNKGYETKRLFVSGVMPPLRYVVEASQRLFGAGRMQRTGTNEDATLYWSELAPQWRDWPISNGVSIFAKPITGIYEWNEIVYVMTATSRWRVTTASYNEGMEFDELESDGVGCVGGHTIQKIGSAVIWLGETGFFATAGDQEPIFISDQISETIDSIRMDRALFFVSEHDRDRREYRCWVTTGLTSTLNDTCLVYDYSRGLLQGKWSVQGGMGRTAYYVSDGVMPSGKRVFFIGDHLGNVFQRELGNADGSGEGGTYQGTLTYGTTTTTTTTTTTSSTTTTV